MKIQLLIIALLSAVLFTACQKEEETNCRDSVIATYEGSDGFGGTTTAKVEEGAGEKGTTIVFTFDNPNTGTNTYTVTGELNEDCNVLTIPTQTIAQTQVSGTLAVTDTKLTGTITLDGINLPVNLDKQ
jgi:hypothetical protein